MLSLNHSVEIKMKIQILLIVFYCFSCSAPLKGISIEEVKSNLSSFKWSGSGLTYKKCSNLEFEKFGKILSTVYSNGNVQDLSFYEKESVFIGLLTSYKLQNSLSCAKKTHDLIEQIIELDVPINLFTEKKEFTTFESKGYRLTIKYEYEFIIVQLILIE